MATVMFLGKKGDTHCQRALDFCRQLFSEVSVYLGGRDEPLPEDIAYAKCDYVFSYLCPWVLPELMLKRAKIAAINFHPASPEYPGTGCINFALYEEAKEYGATCHHMRKSVDSGPIIAVRRFPVFGDDTVQSLLGRTYDYQLALFYDVIAAIVCEQLPQSKESWSGARRTRKDLDQLAVIDPSMSADEIRKRVRATTFGPWRPKVTLHGFNFELCAEV